MARAGGLLDFTTEDEPDDNFGKPTPPNIAKVEPAPPGIDAQQGIKNGAEDAQGVRVGGLVNFTTEDEPDDDFQKPSSQTVSKVEREHAVTDAGGAAADSESKATGMDPDVVDAQQGSKNGTAGDPESKPRDMDQELPEADVVEPSGPLLLEGAWQQLEGVPRQRSARAQLLAWNDYGHVAMYPDQRRIESHHSGDEQPQRFADTADMASISSTACCTASGANSDGGVRLLIRPTDRWEKTAFSVAFPGVDEVPEAVSCGDGFVAALTSRGMLRFYSTSGVPTGMISVAGRSVALAARKRLLMVVTTGGGEDNFEYRLLDARTHTTRANGRLPLSPGAKLRWLGFSAEMAPVTIDTAGIVRALIGTGPGSWGACGGGAGAWVPVLDLAPEEDRLGPLWTVHIAQGILFCAEVGDGREDPQPRPIELENLNSAAPEMLTTPFFGHGTTLRELPWQLPVGPMTIATAALEEALRERILAKHLEDILAAGFPIAEWSGGPSKTWRSKALKLFAEFAKAGELERALDVARIFLATGCASGSKSLDMAERFAERAGQHKLADEVASLSNSGAELADTIAQQATTATPSSQVSLLPDRRKLQPLFRPGELDEFRSDSTAKGAAAGTVDGAAEPTEGDTSAGKAEVTVRATAASGEGSGDNPPVAASEGSANIAPPAVNPFARKKPQVQASVQTPHMLREALLGGSSKRGLTLPATPMAADSSKKARN